jgi:hypothetical protein
MSGTGNSIGADIQGLFSDFSLDEAIGFSTEQLIRSGLDRFTGLMGLKSRSKLCWPA